jgi:hypothetical protein
MPTADWLDETSPFVSVREVSSACTTPVSTGSASWQAASEFCQRFCASPMSCLEEVETG